MLITLVSESGQLAAPDWLDDVTKTIGQYWKRKNAPAMV